MLKLPPSDSPLWAHFDVNNLAIDKLPTLAQFRASANSLIAKGTTTAVHGIVLRADGRLTLERIGRRGGRKTLWTFQAAMIRSSSSRSDHSRGDTTAG
jgi:hypothetical protein